MNVLVVQDEAQIASFIKRELEAEGFAARTARDGAEGLRLTRSSQFDLIILDLLLPSVSGEEVLARMREGSSSDPVIVLTAKDAVSDRVATLKPEQTTTSRNRSASPSCSPGSELVSARRIKQNRWRFPTEPSPSTCMREIVRIDGRSVELTAREFALLETFMRHRGEVLSQPQLLDQVWVYDHEPSSNVVEVYVAYLRKKLRPDVVETVRGMGYRFRG